MLMALIAPSLILIFKHHHRADFQVTVRDLVFAALDPADRRIRRSGPLASDERPQRPWPLPARLRVEPRQAAIAKRSHATDPRFAALAPRLMAAGRHHIVPKLM